MSGTGLIHIRPLIDFTNADAAFAIFIFSYLFILVATCVVKIWNRKRTHGIFAVKMIHGYCFFTMMFFYFVIPDNMISGGVNRYSIMF